MRNSTRMMLMNDEFNRSQNEQKPMSRAGITDRNYDPGEPDWPDERGGRMPMANRRSRDRMRGGMAGRKDEDYGRGRKRKGMWDDDDDDDDDEEEGSRKDRDWRKNRIFASGTVISEPGGNWSKMGKVDEEHARKWVKKMRNAEGGSGGHYTMEKAEELRRSHYPEGDPMEWYVAINMMHSDYAHVAKKLNVDKDEFYAGMAKAFIDDPDAGEGKLMKYMTHIPAKM